MRGQQQPYGARGERHGHHFHHPEGPGFGWGDARFGGRGGPRVRGEVTSEPQCSPHWPMARPMATRSSGGSSSAVADCGDRAQGPFTPCCSYSKTRGWPKGANPTAVGLTS